MDEFAGCIPEDERQRLMYHLYVLAVTARACLVHMYRRRVAARDPLEAAQAYFNLRPYKEHAGVAYVHLRPNWEVLDQAGELPAEEIDWVDLKVGETGDLVRRRDDYERDCIGEPITWAYCYETAHAKLVGEFSCLAFFNFEPRATRTPDPPNVGRYGRQARSVPVSRLRRSPSRAFL